jgi:DNA polymerase I-like protein with 3'-5' exonuclease and polymerase domains
MYKIQKREITFQDFLKLKSFQPFKKYRNDSKPINFGTIFACTGNTLGKQLRASGFSEEDCDNAIDTFKLENALNTAIFNKPPEMPDIDIKYNIVGTKLRELFFKIYPCLEERVKREQEFALKHGYVRTWTGPVRHLAEFKYMRKNNQKNLVGMDKKLFSKMFAHLKNNAANTTIQTAEVYQAMPTITAIAHHLKEWKLKTRIYGYVHDSFELYVYKPERDLVYALINKIAQIERQPYYGIKQHVDIDEVDLDKKDEYLKHGRSVNIEKFNLNKELKKWNDNYETNLVFNENCIPIHGKLI